MEKEKNNEEARSLSLFCKIGIGAYAAVLMEAAVKEVKDTFEEMKLPDYWQP